MKTLLIATILVFGLSLSQGAARMKRPQESHYDIEGLEEYVSTLGEFIATYINFVCTYIPRSGPIYPEDILLQF